MANLNVCSTRVPKWVPEIFAAALDEAGCDSQVDFFFTSRKGWGEGTTWFYQDDPVRRVVIEGNLNAPRGLRWLLLHEASHVIYGINRPRGGNHGIGFYMGALDRYVRFGLDPTWALWRELSHPSSLDAAKRLKWSDAIINTALFTEVKDHGYWSG